MPIFHTAILLYDKKQFPIPAIATEQESPYFHFHVILHRSDYCQVASIRMVNFSITNSFAQKSQYILKHQISPSQTVWKSCDQNLRKTGSLCMSFDVHLLILTKETLFWFELSNNILCGLSYLKKK